MPAKNPQNNTQKRIDLTFNESLIRDISEGVKTATIRYNLEPIRQYFIIKTPDQRQKGAAKVKRHFRCQLRNATELIDYYDGNYTYIDDASLLKQMNKYYEDVITPSTEVHVIIFEAIV